MSTAWIKAAPRKLVASFTSTLGVGSSSIADVIDISNYKSFVGITSVDSSNVVVRFQQGGTTTMDVSSTLAAAAGETLIDWTAYGQYGEFAISAVNSTQGEILNFHVYGIPV